MSEQFTERVRWTKQERKDRDIGIMEKWQLGWSREAIAEHYDLTVQRISQIVNSFGATFRR